MLFFWCLHQSTNVKQGFLLQTYHLPRMKMHLGRLVDFLQKSLVPRFSPKMFLKRWNLSCFVRFQKQYPNDLLSCQKFCWFSFDLLSIICTIVLSTFLAIMYFTSQLHICYLTSCSFHPFLYMGMFMLCLFALPDFVYMHFGAFIISFIKYCL